MAVKEFYLLPSGFLTLDRSILLTGTDIGKKVRIPVYSILLISEEGPVLIDAGLNPEGIEHPKRAWGPRADLIKPEITEADDIRNRLKELNLDVSDIKMVIITHLHWDHTGALRFFNHCPIVVQRAELRFAFNPDSSFSAQYMKNHFDHPLNYQAIEGDHKIMDGISVIKTSGHTPGHQSVIIKLSSGAYYIFPGDAILVQENLTKKIPSSNNWSAEQSVESIFRLENISSFLGGKIIPSHDIVSWNNLKKSPEGYR